eukprot:scpid112029/ scgid20450/ 
MMRRRACLPSALLLVDLVSGEDELRLVDLLLVDIPLCTRIPGASHTPFKTNIGTPQGGSLSPVLFTVYREAAPRSDGEKLPTRPADDVRFPIPTGYGACSIYRIVYPP